MGSSSQARPETVERLRSEYADRIRQLSKDPSHEGSVHRLYSRDFEELAREALETERDTVIALRNEESINGGPTPRQHDIDLAGLPPTASNLIAHSIRSGLTSPLITAHPRSQATLGTVPVRLLRLAKSSRKTRWELALSSTWRSSILNSPSSLPTPIPWVPCGKASHVQVTAIRAVRAKGRGRHCFAPS
jgi:hypothetical protein